jgi:hypothetical protein
MRRSRWAVLAVTMPLLAALAACSAARGDAAPAAAAGDLPALTQPTGASSGVGSVRAAATSPVSTATVTGLPPVLTGPPAAPATHCTDFPADNIWHAKVSGLPVDPPIRGVRQEHRRCEQGAPGLRVRDL